ncbi:MAG: alpha/beta hydrolase [Pseudonocardiales bacterium]
MRDTPADIRGTTVLPARREPITLHTADGLRLVGELALPLERPPVATLICLHPLPTQGGMMDSHLLRKAAFRLPALAGLAVLRFNTRGACSAHGCSEGQFGDGAAERHDVAAALEYADYKDLPAPWLLGWSFGTDLALQHGCDPTVVGAVLISPPLRTSTDADLDVWAAAGKPLVCIVPEYDDYLRPAAALERFARIPRARVVAISGGQHLLVGYTDEVLDEVVRAILPGAVPLPRRFATPVSRATTT